MKQLGLLGLTTALLLALCGCREEDLLGQGILTIFMLLGRLELYTVLILFLPSFWKR